MLEGHNDQALLKELKSSAQIMLIPPVSFLEMIMLEKHASLIMTDSGGVQKESYFYHKPCVILRPETEWVEIVENGSAIIADADEKKILSAYDLFKTKPPASFPPLYGDGKAAWKESIGYHRRSLAETAMSRLKTNFGDRLKNRKMPNQITEVALRCKLLNWFVALGMPLSAWS